MIEKRLREVLPIEDYTEGKSMSELKPCPFCGLNLEHIVSSYKNRNGNEVTEDYFQHPLNDCILSTIPSDGFRIGNCGKDIIDWNTRQPRFGEDEINALRNVLDFAKDGSEMAYENDLMVSCDQEHADCAMNAANRAIATAREMLKGE